MVRAMIGSLKRNNLNNKEIRVYHVELMQLLLRQTCDAVEPRVIARGPADIEMPLPIEESKFKLVARLLTTSLSPASTRLGSSAQGYNAALTFAFRWFARKLHLSPYCLGATGFPCFRNMPRTVCGSTFL
jgi:hypothetical protein